MAGYPANWFIRKLVRPSFFSCSVTLVGDPLEISPLSPLSLFPASNSESNSFGLYNSISALLETTYALNSAGPVPCVSQIHYIDSKARRGYCDP